MSWNASEWKIGRYVWSQGMTCCTSVALPFSRYALLIAPSIVCFGTHSNSLYTFTIGPFLFKIVFLFLFLLWQSFWFLSLLIPCRSSICDVTYIPYIPHMRIPTSTFNYSSSRKHKYTLKDPGFIKARVGLDLSLLSFLMKCGIQTVSLMLCGGIIDLWDFLVRAYPKLPDILMYKLHCPFQIFTERRLILKPFTHSKHFYSHWPFLTWHISPKSNHTFFSNLVTY